MRRWTMLLALICLSFCCVSAHAGDPLAGSFVNHPQTAQPWVFWFWVSGQVSPEGITFNPEWRSFLDFGMFGDMAVVKVNGEDFGVLWTPLSGWM